MTDIRDAEPGQHEDPAAVYADLPTMALYVERTDCSPAAREAVLSQDELSNHSRSSHPVGDSGKEE